MSLSFLSIIGLGFLGLIVLGVVSLPVAEMLSYRGEEETPKREITGLFSLIYWRLLPITVLIALGIGFFVTICFMVGVLMMLLFGLLI